ncbi:uncharacterized protein LOC113464894, partial [Ceratina calcarata]|uniref:Uncharacterized protein LOC113464894 n=1 Tax=Ceratina calcarata TaxID=156304 RepID=A0AAJ7S9D2_9HYME
MDLNENVVVGVEQRDRSEKSQPDTADEKNSSTGNEREENRELPSRGSNDSVRNGDSANPNENGKRPCRKASLRRENWETKMCEQAKDLVCQVNYPDGNVANCTGENIWQHNYGDECPASRYDAKRTNDPNRNCKSGINISVVSRQEIPCENLEVEKPMYSVSFKRCFDSCGEANYRCTFENCCGNCEPYIMEIQDDDCGAYQSWQNTDFDSRNSCFEECCCTRDMKVYSSNMSVRRRRSCSTYSEAGNCCSSEPKCDFLATDTSSKQCLQRVHFAKLENCAKANHSACSFCSRKCTPSKASLFVEIGESVADVCKLASGQTIRCEDSTESLKDDRRKDRVKRNKSDSLRSKLKRSGPKCNLDCKGRPGAVARSCSDRIATIDTHDCTEQMHREPFCAEMARTTRSTVCFQDMRDCRAQTDSSMYLNKKMTGCSQQCEAIDYSLLDDIRRGKIWSQLQDTYKSFMKVATTSIGQIVKQSSKLKRSKTCASKERERFTCGTCTNDCANNVTCADQCNQSEPYNDCLYGGQCWKEMITHKANKCDVHCCRNVCYENIAGLPNCQMPLCQNDCWKPIVHAEVISKKDCRSRPRSKNLRHLPHNSFRKRGGGETNQKKKVTGKRASKNQNLSPMANPAPMAQSNPATQSNPANSQQAIAEPQMQPFEIHDDQIERATVHIDVSVQANAIRARVEPSAPYVQESMTYEKRVKAIQRLGMYPDAMPLAMQEQESPVIQEIGTTLHPLPRKEESKVIKRLALQRAPRKQSSTTARSTVAEAPSRIRHDVSRPAKKQVTKPDRVLTAAQRPAVGRGVQCMLIRESPPVSGIDPRQIPSRTDPCTCRPRPGPSAARLGQPLTSVPTRPARQTDRLPSRVEKIDRVQPARPVADVCVRDPADILRPSRTRVPDVQRVPSVPPPARQPSATPARQPSATPARPPSVTPARPPSVTPARPPSAILAGIPPPAPPPAQTDSFVSLPTYEGDDIPDDIADEAREDVPDEARDDGADEVRGDGDDRDADVDDLSDIDALRPDDPSAAVTMDDQADDAGPQDPEGDTSDSPIVSSPSQEDISPSTSRPAATSSPVPAAPPIATAPEAAPTDAPIADTTALQPMPDMPQDLDRSLPGGPFEFSKEINGRRMHVSVQMQTSNTILTQILSEFQIGNRKRQVLMSIKLQANLDDQQQPHLQTPPPPP